MELDVHTVVRAQRGDRRAQGAVLSRYAGPLHAFVRRTWPPGSDADDLVQSLLARLLEVLPRFDPKGPATLTTWVFTVAHRWLIDERRRRHLAVAPLDEGLEVEDPAPRPDARAADGELRGALEAAIGKLPDAQRRVFVLAHVHEQPLEAVAEVEGVPVGTVKSRLFRARAALALELGALLDERVEGGRHAVR